LREAGSVNKLLPVPGISELAILASWSTSTGTTRRRK
jgi:hypothetical protein